VIDRTNPTTLYAGIGVRVSKSTDGGATWSEAGGLGIGVNVVAIDPVNPSILYAATNAGLFKSADAGASWFAINEGLANMVDTRSPVTELVVDFFHGRAGKSVLTDITVEYQPRRWGKSLLPPP